MYGYFSEGEIVGYISLNKNSDTSFEIKNLCILPEYRHKGYGKELLEYQ